ncbi:TMEM165/GDT1 family protein [Thermosynechococcaceae cyanobacterium BACA0444]|uniref:GDT1 family protein n=1 Tax=Pseudocalidococcus azoricus BACA0444 TaxID=2918990 RepID=A0AAE4FNN4_9CYAN|nr:TMEM165/GDT1 family protein [Pseudocalidococcus azoricus]MDS3859429.1 TMEM165/GDT1 family protein [Pseudocalidococcus azoricus BACA0444]
MLTAFTAGLLLITVSEIGDKTFFIGVILATRHPKRWVFLGAWLALSLMTILSVLMGQVLALLPPQYTRYGAIGLFMFFGLRLLYQAWKMPAQGVAAETAEAEELVEKAEKEMSPRQANSAWAIVGEAFTLTFLAEWGDRTQIATLTLAAAQNPWGVALGAITGHGISTLIAVVGGGLLAGRISERNITLLGGILFLIFAMVMWVEGI